jgi:hypothetical protein
MADHSAHLIAAIDDLKRRRREIDDAIASMETVLANIYHVANATVTPATVAPPAVRVNVTPGPGSRAARVRRVFAEHPEGVWTSETLAEAIGEDPDEGTIKAIHGILSRLRKDGMIDNVGRGEYRYAPEDTSAPAATGAEEGEESTSDPSRKEGDDDNDSPLPEGRDDGAGRPLVVHDLGDRRAAIVGGS